MPRVAAELLAVRQFRDLNITNPKFFLVCIYTAELGGLLLNCLAYISRQLGL